MRSTCRSRPSSLRAREDGRAIVLNDQAQKIVYANVQLMPDPAISSEETGTRHRTAERVAKQTDAPASIPQQRETVTIFIGDLRYQLGEISTSSPARTRRSGRSRRTSSGSIRG